MEPDIIKEQLFQYLINKATFESKIKKYFESNYFQFLYQSLYYSLYSILINYSDCPSNLFYKIYRFTKKKIKLSYLFRDNNFIMLMDDIYQTRLSKEGVKVLTDRLSKYDNWSSYRETLKIFLQFNPRRRNGKISKINAISLGTKVLHVYDPINNPLVDDVILKNLKLKKYFDKDGIDFCNNFQIASIQFCNEKHDYFNLSNEIKKYFKTINIDCNIPRMKLLDIVLYDKSSM